MTHSDSPQALVSSSEEDTQSITLMHQAQNRSVHKVVLLFTDVSTQDQSLPHHSLKQEGSLCFKFPRANDTHFRRLNLHKYQCGLYIHTSNT